MQGKVEPSELVWEDTIDDRLGVANDAEKQALWDDRPLFVPSNAERSPVSSMLDAANGIGMPEPTLRSLNREVGREAAGWLAPPPRPDQVVGAEPPAALPPTVSGAVAKHEAALSEGTVIPGLPAMILATASFVVVWAAAIVAVVTNGAH